jgi:hypothetical protein
MGNVVVSDRYGFLSGHLPALSDERRYGRSALLLVESLIHAFVARGTISAHEAIEITKSAHEVLCALNDDQPVGNADMLFDEQPLLNILASIRIDVPIEDHEN